MRQSLRSWLWGVPLEQEVDEELVFHLEMHTRDLIAGGMDPKTAREVAASRLGDVKRLKRTCVDLGRKRDREMRLVQWLDEFRDDVTFAVRQLRRSPGFTVVAAVTLALGIGANSAIFALADATLLRPLPLANPDRLMMLWEHSPTTDHNVVAPYEFVEWNDRNHTFESMAAAAAGGAGRAMTGPDGTGEQIQSQAVSVQFFDVFGVKPIAGRTFVAADDHQNPDAVVLGEGLWRSRFAADPGLIGRQIKLDGQPSTVIGIVPAEFRVLAPSGAWTLLATPLMRSPFGLAHYLRVIGRLKPGTTLGSARADMTAIAQAIARERPELNRDRGVTTEPLRDGLIGRELRLTSMLLLGVVGFVLLTCCANVANLLLARTTVRARELAVRSALGAGRRRIVRLLLTESLVLTSFAGLIGAAVGAAILKAAPSQIPPGLLPVGVTLAFDGRVLTFCVAAAFVVAVVFGAAPAWQATRLPIVQVITSGGRGATGGGARFRSLLAMGQVAAAVLLLCGAGLLLRSLNALAQVDPGYRAREVLTMVVSIPFTNPFASSATPYATPAARRQFYDAVEQEVRRLPGVRSVGWGSALPLDGWWVGMGFQVDGEPPQPEAMRPLARYQNVSPSYFQTLDLPILAGRAFTSRDTTQGPPVCIVNEIFVRRYLGGRAPLGARIEVRGMTTGGAPLPVREIVGVVKQAPERPDETEPQPHIYVPLAQDSAWQASLVVQPTDGSASALTPSVRAAVARIDKERPVAQVRTLTTIGREATSVARFRAVLVGTFAGLALTLAIVGVFGVLAYSVQQRVREFGIRMALGATTGDVLGLVFASAGGVIAAGAVIGLAAAALLGRSISAFLFGVQPLDLVTFASVALLLALTAALATAVPALRAARVDPATALRNE